MSKEAAADIVAIVNKALKKDVLKLGSDDAFKTSMIPTGMLPIDILLGGGIPRGRMVTLYGSFSTGKSLIGLKAIRECQRLGGTAALVDTEHVYDEEWAKRLGIDTEALVLLDYENETGEAALDAAEALIRTRQIDLLVFDSISAAVPIQEHDSSNDDQKPALLARLMSKALRKLTAANRDTAVLFVSQTRTNIGITFGTKDTVAGGNATGFYSSMMVRLSKRGNVTRDVKAHTGVEWTTAKEIVQQVYHADLTKSKLNKPHRQISFIWDLTVADVDTLAFVFAQGLEHGFITQKGSWWVYESVDSNGEVLEVKAQGADKFKAALIEQGLVDTLVSRVTEIHGLDNIYSGDIA